MTEIEPQQFKVSKTNSLVMLTNQLLPKSDRFLLNDPTVGTTILEIYGDSLVNGRDDMSFARQIGLTAFDLLGAHMPRYKKIINSVSPRLPNGRPMDPREIFSSVALRTAQVTGGFPIKPIQNDSDEPFGLSFDHKKRKPARLTAKVPENQVKPLDVLAPASVEGLPEKIYDILHQNIYAAFLDRGLDVGQLFWFGDGHTELKRKRIGKQLQAEFIGLARQGKLRDMPADLRQILGRFFDVRVVKHGTEARLYVGEVMSFERLRKRIRQEEGSQSQADAKIGVAFTDLARRIPKTSY